MTTAEATIPFPGAEPLHLTQVLHMLPWLAPTALVFTVLVCVLLRWTPPRQAERDRQQ